MRLDITSINSSRCPLHKAGHTLNDCRGFRKRSLQDRQKFLRENRICFKCCSLYWSWLQILSRSVHMHSCSVTDITTYLTFYICCTIFCNMFLWLATFKTYYWSFLRENSSCWCVLSSSPQKNYESLCCYRRSKQSYFKHILFSRRNFWRSCRERFLNPRQSFRVCPAFCKGQRLELIDVMSNLREITEGRA
jgi:hypothetical protein